MTSASLNSVQTGREGSDVCVLVFLVVHLNMGLQRFCTAHCLLFSMCDLIFSCLLFVRPFELFNYLLRSCLTVICITWRWEFVRFGIPVNPGLNTRWLLPLAVPRRHSLRHVYYFCSVWFNVVPFHVCDFDVSWCNLVFLCCRGDIYFVCIPYLLDLSFLIHMVRHIKAMGNRYSW